MYNITQQQICYSLGFVSLDFASSGLKQARIVKELNNGDLDLLQIQSFLLSKTKQILNQKYESTVMFG